MKLEYQGKSLEYNLDGSLKGTVVTLGHLDGGYLPILLQGDQTALSNQELFERAMEKHYQENFSMRAENERFNLMDKKIAEIDQATERSNAQYTKVEEILKLTTATVNELIASMMSGEDNEETI